MNKIFARQNDVLHLVESMKAGLSQSHHQPDEPFTPGASSANFILATSSALQEKAAWDAGINDTSTDSLKIPSSRITPDSVLAWPIFENRYPPSYLQDAVFESAGWGDGFSPAETTTTAGMNSTAVPKTPRAATMSFKEDDVVNLVDRFLSLVHTKNPIVDVDVLRSYARKIAEEGLSWDGPSCLVVG